MTLIAMLTALSFVLYMFLKFPLPFMFPGFLDMQFSDLPALIGGYMIGPLGGCIIIVLKCLLKMPFTSTYCVGEVADIIVGVAFVLSSSLIYRAKRTKKWAGLSLIFGTLIAVATSVLANAFILIPAFSHFFSWNAVLGMVRVLFPNVSKQNFYAYYLPLSVLPFNILRCGLCSVVTFFVYKSLSRAVNKLFEPKQKSFNPIEVDESSVQEVDETELVTQEDLVYEETDENKSNENNSNDTNI